MPTRSSRLKTLREIIEAFPPFLVITVAKRQFDIEEISKRSGIPLRTLFRIAKMTSNNGLKVEQLLALWASVDFCPFQSSTNPMMRYLNRIVKRGAQMPHLTRKEWMRFCALVERARLLRLSEPRP